MCSQRRARGQPQDEDRAAGSDGRTGEIRGPGVCTGCFQSALVTHTSHTNKLDYEPQLLKFHNVGIALIFINGDEY